MSQLEEMKGRAEKAADARLKYNDSEDEGQDGALSIRAAFIAEQSSYDVPKLIAALEAVEIVLRRLDFVQGGHPTSNGHLRRPGEVQKAMRAAITEALA